MDKNVWPIICLWYFTFLLGSLYIPVIAVWYRVIGLTYAVIGILTTIPYIARVPTSIFVGRFVDKVGRKPCTVLGPLLSAVGLVLIPLLHEPWIFIVVWVGLTGAGYSFIIVSLTTMSYDVAPVEKAGEYMGTARGIGLLGLGMGSLISGLVLSVLGYFITFYFAAVIYFVSCLIGLFFINETKKVAVKYSSSTNTITEDLTGKRKVLVTVKSYKSLIKNRVIFSCLLINMVYWFMLILYLFWVPIFLREIGVATFFIGIFPGIFYIIYGLVALLGGRLSDKVGRRVAIGLGLSLTAIGCFSLRWVGSDEFTVLTTTFLTALISGSGAGIYGPLAYAVAADASDPSIRGGAMGFVQSFSELGAVFSPMLISFILTVTNSWITLFTVMSIAPIFGLTIVAFLLPETFHKIKKV
ncbi:MAG: MFS transporter [Candidatus Bathyarchaeota archaeon]